MSCEVPGFGELLEGSIRDGIGMGHEDALEWQRAHLRDGFSHRRARTRMHSNVRGRPDLFVAPKDACCDAPSPVVVCAGGHEQICGNQRATGGVEEDGLVEKWNSP
jgi:hypothetical protein